VLALGDYMGVTCHACIGGTNVRDDMKRLEAGAQIVVGTPGRVYDMLNRSALRMSKERDRREKQTNRLFSTLLFR